jgi:hypothetical protein
MVPAKKDKDTYTGVIRLQHVGGSSKSGRVTHVLDTGDGHPLILRLQGGNAMREPGFDKFLNQRVTFEGSLLASNIVAIDDLKDIAVLGPAGRPSRPPAPKM